jgi:hypothetical protein
MAIASIVVIGTLAMNAVAAEEPHASTVTGASVVPLEIPAARRVPVPMAPFLKQHPRFEDAFAAAVAVAAERAAAERIAGGGEAVRAVVELPPGRHRLTKDLMIIDQADIGIDGGGCTLVQTAWQSVFEIRDCRNVVISNLALDYDPVPFTQGTVTALDATGKTIDVNVDKGYPCDAGFAARLARGGFQVMDRDAESFAIGGRYAMHPVAAQALPDGILRVEMAWSANELGPGQKRLAIGDVVTLLAFGPVAVVVRQSEGVSFSQCSLHAAPRFGMVFLGGGGGTVLDRVQLVPGPPPVGADRPRLCCTNADGTHFNSVVRGPTITDCVYRLTADDPVNVHGFYCYVVDRVGPRTFLLSPRNDLGLEAGDTIDVFDRETCAGKGGAVVLDKKVRPSTGLQQAIEQVWTRRSPTTVKQLVYEVTLDRDLDLSVGDAVSSRTRTGAGIVVRGSSFHGGGRVMVKAPNARIENNSFSRTNAAAIHVGSDIGYWSESRFAENVTIRSNTFRGCGMAANHFFADSEVFATIYVGCTHPLNAAGLLRTYDNRNILIEGNRIEDSYAAGLEITNADGVLVRDNTIGQTFLRGDAFAAGKKFGIVPDAAVIIAMAQNVTLTGNAITTGPVARRAVSVHPSCDESVRIVEPVPTGNE